MAKILLLGEHDKGLGMPFHPATTSGRRLRGLISEVGLVCELGNVFAFAEGKAVEQDLRPVAAGYSSVVALGKVAAAECARQGITAEYLPHPAVRGSNMLQRLRVGLDALAHAGVK